MTTDIPDHLKIARLDNPLLNGYLKFRTEYLLPGDNPKKPEHRYLNAIDFQDKFVDMTPQGLAVFHAPVVKDFHVVRRWHIGRKNPKLYDVYQSGLGAVVSAKAKNIIEAMDPMTHQWTPLPFIDKQGQEMNVEYFSMVCRRYITLEAHAGDSFQKVILDPFCILLSDEEGFLSNMENHKEYREFLSEQFCWCPKARQPFYLSMKMLTALRDAGCSGIEHATVKKNDKNGAIVYYV